MLIGIGQCGGIADPLEGKQRQQPVADGGAVVLRDRVLHACRCKARPHAVDEVGRREKKGRSRYTYEVAPSIVVGHCAALKEKSLSGLNAPALGRVKRRPSTLRLVSGLP